MTLPDLESVNYTIALATLLGIPLAIWRSKSRKRLSAAADAILGQEPVTDRRGSEIIPGAPGLVHRVHTTELAVIESANRVSKVEEAIVEFRHLTGIVTEALGRIDSLDSRVKAMEDSRVSDIVQAAERAATAAVSTQMLRMIQDHDTVDGKATEPGGEL